MKDFTTSGNWLVKRQKPIFYTPAPPDLIEDLANSCDAVLTAIGD
jgi:hypothetical protein